MLKSMVEHDHDQAAIIARLSQTKHSYLRDWVYGGIDGAVTTFAVVAGVTGAHLAPLVIMVLGVANLLGDGFSMAAANFVGTKTEAEEHKFYEKYEHQQIHEEPLGEKEEIRQLFIKKGFSGEVLEKIVERITKDPTLWVKTMLREEYGLATEVRSPWKAAVCTFLAFIICGFIPLLSFAIHLPSPFLLSIILTGAVFFVIGSLKSIWSTQSFWRSGLMTFMIGSIAASLAYFVGMFFNIVH